MMYCDVRVDFESTGHNMTNLQLQLANVFFTHDRYKYTNETGEPEQNYTGKIFHVLKFRKSTGHQLHWQDRNMDFGSQRCPLCSAEQALESRPSPVACSDQAKSELNVLGERGFFGSSWCAVNWLKLAHCHCRQRLLHLLLDFALNQTDRLCLRGQS